MASKSYSHISALRVPTAEDPLRILVSACLLGVPCGVDGSGYGEYPSALKLVGYKNIKLIKFCPEHFSFGTPREMCDIHGGTGIDVINGTARVLTESGVDWTAGMIKAAEAMLDIAKSEKAELALMMDISAACGSQVIYDGNRYSENKKYRVGMGVAAAMLSISGYPVVSQRDFASLERLYALIDPTHVVNPDAIDHDEGEWYRSYFKS